MADKKTSTKSNTTAKDGLSRVVSFKVHPSIGIARVGNSPESFFVGPEIPGAPVPIGGFKDKGEPDKNVAPRIKRQAARFRIFGYDKDNQPVCEITSLDAQITWSVHLANKKAEWDTFDGHAGEQDALSGTRRARQQWRNADIDDRDSLIIDPGVRSLCGNGQSALFNGGKFRGIDVPLGEIETDDQGRLLVLGGFGKSGSSNPNQLITDYANNDFWHDDISDGPVGAKIKLNDSEQEAAPAWVIVAPPDYAPSIQNIVSLYDVVLDTGITKGFATLPKSVSFTSHIYPILKRTLDLQWVQKMVLDAHGSNAAVGFDFDNMMKKLADKTAAGADARNRVFGALRTPEKLLVEQANRYFMPYLSGDEGSATPGDPTTWLTLTKTQYALMKEWAAGNFDADWDNKRADTTEEITSAGLDRAALESCAGGPFFPGTEGGWLFRNPEAFIELGRFDPKKFAAGDITKRMACPWQADFFECRRHWWPGQRPDEVLPLANYERIVLIEKQLAELSPETKKYKDLVAERTSLWNERVSWARGLPTSSPAGDNEMVQKWATHGFVVDRTADGTFELKHQIQHVETERLKYDGLSEAEYFHIMMNIEDYADFLPTARRLALDFFADADYGSDPSLAKFDYTEEAFDDRMKKIYDDFVVSMNDEPWQESGLVPWDMVVGRNGDQEIVSTKIFDVKRFSDRAVRERIKQAAPFNLIDGAWLQKIISVGPCDEVHARLFSIWGDEAGNGQVNLNHCNVYDTLLKSVNIYMPPVKSREFIEQDFLPGAFTQAVFQLSTGLFPDEFLPELLGMTLYLEWEATPTLLSIQHMYDRRHINSHFYRMHVAIDNISAGHGALAKEAIKLYLEDKRNEGGEEAVQDAWQRIWNGYVTWASAGSLGREFIERLMIFDRKQIDIAPCIFSLKPLSDTTQFCTKLLTKATSVFSYLFDLLNAEASDALQRWGSSGNVSTELEGLIVTELNRILALDGLWDPKRFEGVAQRERTKQLLSEFLKIKPEQRSVADIVEVNRYLLEDALPDLLIKRQPRMFPDYQAFFARQMADLIRKKAPIALPVHKGKIVQGVNDSGRSQSYDLGGLFENPSMLMSVLQTAGYVDPEHPRQSKFFDYLEFQGPMYKVFKDEEKNIILDWIESLRAPTGSPSEPAPPPADPAQDMLRFIQTYAARAKNEPAHANVKLNDSAGNAKSIQEWVSDPRGLMKALVFNGWVVPGDPDSSRFYQLFVGNGPMAPYFSTTDTDTIRSWIVAGANLLVAPFSVAPLGSAELMALSLGSTKLLRRETEGAQEIELPEPSVYAKPNHLQKRQLRGMGAVH